MKQQTDDPVITDLQGKETMTTACSHHLMRETSSISQHPLLRKLQPPEALTSPAKLGLALLICSATSWQCACALPPSKTPDAITVLVELFLGITKP